MNITTVWFEKKKLIRISDFINETISTKLNSWLSKSVGWQQNWFPSGSTPQFCFVQAPDPFSLSIRRSITEEVNIVEVRTALFLNFLHARQRFP